MFCYHTFPFSVTVLGLVSLFQEVCLSKFPLTPAELFVLCADEGEASDPKRWL